MAAPCPSIIRPLLRTRCGLGLSLTAQAVAQASRQRLPRVSRFYFSDGFQNESCKLERITLFYAHMNGSLKPVSMLKGSNIFLKL